jgi:hypothetical protein
VHVKVSALRYKLRAQTFSRLCYLLFARRIRRSVIVCGLVRRNRREQSREQKERTERSKLSFHH